METFMMREKVSNRPDQFNFSELHHTVMPGFYGYRTTVHEFNFVTMQSLVSLLLNVCTERQTEDIPEFNESQGNGTQSSDARSLLDGLKGREREGLTY